MAEASGSFSPKNRRGCDAAGNRLYTVDPAGHVLFTDYDNANRVRRDYFAVPAI